MNENVGVSFGLSVLVVVFFAVALYQPDKPPPALAEVRPSPGPLVEPSPPAPQPAPALPTVGRDEPPPAEQTKPISPQPAVAQRFAPAKAVPARAVSRRPAVEPEGARGPFVRVREGETLADVARRVYGDGADAGALWRANRDVLDGPASPVRAGTRLRTP